MHGSANNLLGMLTALLGAKIINNCGGFSLVSPLSLMNRQNMNTPEETKPKLKP
jgi:hypothetical protein